MRKLKKGIIIAIVSIIITLGISVYGSVAYFTESVDSTGNRLVGSSGVQNVTLSDYTYNENGDLIPSPTYINVVPGMAVDKSVSVKNSNSTPVYVRVKYDVSITLSELERGRENEIDLALVELNVNESKWVYQDGYYYYDGVLDSGEQTENALSSVSFSKDMGNLYKDSVVNIKTRLETVQANNNGATVFDAVGWVTSNNEGGSL